MAFFVLGESVSTNKPNIHTRLMSEPKPLANWEESLYKGELVVNS